MLYFMTILFTHITSESAMGAESSINQFLSLLPVEVSKELTIVDSNTLNQSHLLHISKDTSIKRFTPAVTRRSMEGENSSVPRISTAPTLAGCILGYASDLYDFMEHANSATFDRKRRVAYRGGWAIYGLPFQTSLRPSAKLLPDVKRTDEHWLVTHDESTVAYTPVLLGKFFYESVLYKASAEAPRPIIDVFVEVLTETPIPFTRNVQFEKGFWKIKVDSLHNAERWDKIQQSELQELTRQDYLNSKRVCASLLSFDEAAPRTSKW